MFGKYKNIQPATAYESGLPTGPREAFEGCPNRVITTNRTGNNELQIKCAKYVETTEIGYINVESAETRAKVAQKLGCFGCKFNRVEVGEQRRSEQMDKLHPVVAENAGPLFATEHYPEAAMKGFSTVRGRLRDLTGFEKAADAFGKGRLRIEGASAEHVDADFQKAAQYLMMSIDMFRNEGAHSDFGSATGSERSLEYLTLSSLAMSLLDNAVSTINPVQ